MQLNELHAFAFIGFMVAMRFLWAFLSLICDMFVIAVVGGADDSEIDKAYEMGVTAVFPINRLPQDFSISRHHSKENLGYTVDNILRLLAAK